MSRRAIQEVIKENLRLHTCINNLENEVRYYKTMYQGAIESSVLIKSTNGIELNEKNTSEKDKYVTFSKTPNDNQYAK